MPLPPRSRSQEREDAPLVFGRSIHHEREGTWVSNPSCLPCSQANGDAAEIPFGVVREISEQAFDVPHLHDEQAVPTRLSSMVKQAVQAEMVHYEANFMQYEARLRSLVADIEKQIEQQVEQRLAVAPTSAGLTAERQSYTVKPLNGNDLCFEGLANTESERYDVVPQVTETKARSSRLSFIPRAIAGDDGVARGIRQTMSLACNDAYGSSASSSAPSSFAHHQCIEHHETRRTSLFRVCLFFHMLWVPIMFLIVTLGALIRFAIDLASYRNPPTSVVTVTGDMSYSKYTRKDEPFIDMTENVTFTLMTDYFLRGSNFPGCEFSSAYCEISKDPRPTNYSADPALHNCSTYGEVWLNAKRDSGQFRFKKKNGLFNSAQDALFLFFSIKNVSACHAGPKTMGMQPFIMFGLLGDDLEHSEALKAGVGDMDVAVAQQMMLPEPFTPNNKDPVGSQFQVALGTKLKIEMKLERRVSLEGEQSSTFSFSESTTIMQTDHKAIVQIKPMMMDIIKVEAIRGDSLEGFLTVAVVMGAFGLIARVYVVGERFTAWRGIVRAAEAQIANSPEEARGQDPGD